MRVGGINRGAVEAGKRVIARRGGAGRWTGETLEGAAANFRGHHVDIANGSTVEGFAASVWCVSDGASSISEMGANGGAAKSASWVGPASQREGWIRFYGRLRRRNIFAGKKRGFAVGKTKRGKGSKIMAITDGQGLPLALHLESASPAEVSLLEATLHRRFVPELPQRLIADRAYDSDPLRDRLADQHNLILLSPHRRNRIRPAWHDGRSLRRYAKRWKIERFFAWLHQFRRLVTRYEFHSVNFLGFLQLACSLILLRYL